MPQEDETVSDRGDDASPAPQSNDSRDRIFTRFCEATELKLILSSFQALCQEAEADPDSYEEVYPTLKKTFTAWKPASYWELLDKRAALPEYDSQKACRGRRVLVIGAGPVGLRMAIEAALLGAKVDLVEKRDNFSRNNSLHLWSFLITDLRNLGAKKFHGKFASGSLDHICIRILQSILMKVCLLLGVRIYINIVFSSLIEPTSSSTGWRVSTNPPSCPVNTYEFDAILAADGKKQSLPGFRLKEFRAKLALAITANFVNSNTQQENSVPEISGVSYVYRMDFFNTLAEQYGIELENIVYYKSETHYFVMTATKTSLLKKGVLVKDYNDPKQLLSASNIHMAALKKYTVEAAEFSTQGALPLTFEKNYRGEDDVALFDFTSLFASENAARIVERKGHKVLLCVAGDSLNEPFWPTGSGCGRGFLGAFDAVWMLKRFCAGTSPLELVEEREALFYLLPQTTPERLAKNLTGYTIDPKTRYPSLSELVPPGDVSHLYDTDNPAAKPAPTSHQPRQPPLQDPAKPLKEAVISPQVKAPSVSGGLHRIPVKRSRSSEGLSPIAESTRAAQPALPAKPVESSSKHDSREASPATQSPRPLRKRIQMLEAKETAVGVAAGSKSTKEKKDTETKQKKKTVSPLQKDTQTKQKKITPSPSQKDAQSKQKLASPVREVSPVPSPGETEKVQGSPKSRQRGLLRLFDRSRSKSPSPTPSSDDEPKETPKTKRTKRKVAESPKGHEQAHAHVGSTHPLSVTKQSPAAPASRLESPMKETEQKSTSETQKAEEDPHQVSESVADIVKRLDPHKASAEPTEKHKKKEKVKKKGKDKEKAKQEGARESREKETDTKGSRFLSFFKGKKSYDVAKASSSRSAASSATSSSPKLKKRTKSEKEQVQSLSEKPPVSLQQRIQRLRELGVGNLETDGPDIMSLEEVIALETSSGITLDEEEEEEEGEVEEVRGRSVSPGYSEEGVESQSSHSRSTSPVYSGGEDPRRSESRTSHTSAGATCRDSRSMSPVEGGDEREPSPEGEEKAQMERTVSVVETVRQLEPLSAADSVLSMKQIALAQERKSKEFELAELHSHKADTSNPLWLARIIQGMGKCLERLRREQNDILATKTTLQIISTILSNVQLHPGDDTYRRVRVSSQRFNQKVWQFNQAGQFLARAGWVEIGDYIVLPMGQTVDVAKQVLEKHLNIVNQMLWSQQLELPDSPGVLQKLRGRHGVTARNKTITAAMIARRQSYSSRLVDESLQKVEKEQKAMEAVLVRMNSSQNGDRESSPEENHSGVSEGREDEVHTMRAASAARNKWMKRQEKEALDQRKDREYKLILESELYDLPETTLLVPATTSAKSTSPMPSFAPSPSHTLPTTHDHRSTSGSPSTGSPTQQATNGSPMRSSCDSSEKEGGMEKTVKADAQLDGERDMSSSATSPDTATLSNQIADAQYSTPASIKQDMMQYERITLEAAAQVRQKWRET